MRMGEAPTATRVQPQSRGSIREGVCLGILLHLGIQSLYAFCLVRALGLDIGSAAHVLMMIGGASQLPYMVPAIVDAQLMRQRSLTARGIGIVALAVMCLSIWCLVFSA